MHNETFQKLSEDGLISESEFITIQQFEKSKPVSLYWDLKTLLYTGIILLTSGVGILIYKYIDTIGHDVMITIIGLCWIICFLYCIKKAKPYSNLKTSSPNFWFDYILLLGCLLLLTLIGYIQFQYNVFGNRWGLATFIPMVLLFISAYYFDHLGVLSLAITNLAAWAGITATPLGLIKENDFGNAQIIYSGIVLGAGLIAFAFLSNRKNIKAHFEFTYKNFGTHILLISCLAGLFYFDTIILWFMLIAAAGAGLFRHSLHTRSFYFLVVTLLYFYIALSYVVI